MLTPRRLGAALAAGAAAALTLAVGSAAARPLIGHHDIRGPAGAVFVQTDETSGNTITVYDRHWDGTLAAAGSYLTGGDGGALAGSVVDHLASQNSLVYDASRGELFAVNAGSDTISTFDVNGDRLHLRQVISSGGTFPVSITVHGDLAYALNALNGGSVQGYRILSGRLVAIPGSSRPLGLDPSATPQFTTTPGDIAFTADGRDVLVTTKANGNDIDVFSVSWNGQLSSHAVVNSEPGDVPFSLAFEPGDQVVVGEAGTNAVQSFALRANGTLVPGSTVAAGGAATCWLVSDGPLLFAGNAGSGTESSVVDSPFGQLGLTTTTPTDGGTVDAAASPDGRYLYVQTGALGIVDEFHIGPAGTLSAVGSVTVPDAAGGEGIAVS
jgi:hypothetical protein